MTAGQTEQQWIRQTDRETQITFNGEGREGGAPPPLDLDGEVEMGRMGRRRLSPARD